jgi:hypothetical protein
MTKRFRFLTLAALLVLPLAACDEGDEAVAPTATGSVTGAVTIDGTGQAGVTVTLSSGKTATTNSAGQYTISDVPAGAYTVSISGQPADAAFPSTTQAAVITTAGQVVTVNFAGSRIRTSSIIGAVTGTAGAAINGVNVALTGTEARTTTTAGAGQYSFTGLRAGTYTVTITQPAGQTCAVTTANVTVAAGETRVQNFACVAASTGRISGLLFLDENPKNDLYDGASLEDSLKAANIAVTLEGPTLGVTTTQQTTANGTFSFTNLAPGSFNVRIDATSPNTPAGVVYGGPAQFTVTIATGGTATVNFPYDVTMQTVKAYAFLGRDASCPYLSTGTGTTTCSGTAISSAIGRGVVAVPSVIIDLYPTEQDLNLGTNRLGRDTTDAAGEVQFTFLRSADTSPAGAVTDYIVFADYVVGPTLMTPNGEDQIEIRYNPRFQTGLAPDTFDLLHSRVVQRFDAVGITGTPLTGWDGALYLNDTTAAAVARRTASSDAQGRIIFIDTVGPASLPDTFYMRLSGSQAAAGGVTFTSTLAAQRGAATNRWLRWIHTGTTLNSDTVDVGDERVTLSQVAVYLRVYHERDDSASGGPPRLSSGDNIENTDNIAVTLRWRQTGATVDSVRTLQVQADGVLTFLNVPTKQASYRLAARTFPGPNNQLVLNDTMITIGGGGLLGDMAGGTPLTFVCPLGRATLTGCGTFAFKYTNGVINGRAKAADSTGAAGLIVRLAPIAGVIQPTAAFSDTTDANGLFGFAGIREGKYTLTLTPNASWGCLTPSSCVLTDTVQNSGDVDILNFIVRRLDTAIKGVVVNDRDQDGNVIDPNEALAGVTIRLYRNNTNTSTTAITLDTLVASTTTDANGRYQFLNLPEARYVVQAVQPTTAVVTRGITAAGAHIDTAVVRTAACTKACAAAGGGGEGNNLTKTVGSTTPVPLPRWDYNTSTVFFDGRTNFTFLYNTTVARGVITNAATGAVIPGMTVSLVRCDDSAGATSPPAGPTAGCMTPYPGFATLSTVTDATGTFNFTNLQEGVYVVTPAPGSAGFTTTSPANQMYLLVGPGDIERGDFTAT